MKSPLLLIALCEHLCNSSHMPTNLDIAPDLLEKAVDVGHHPSKRAAVEAALIEYINRHEQAEIIKLFGTIDYDEKYDYKKARRKPCKSS